MAFDWNKRHNSIGQHQHVASQILDDTTAANAFSGGGAADSGWLGPFTLSFDMPNLDTTGVVLTTLPADSRITDVNFFTTVTWDQGGEIDITAGDRYFAIDKTLTIHETNGVFSADSSSLIPNGADGLFQFAPVRWSTAVDLIAYFYPTTDPATAGSTDIYVSVAVA